MAILLICCALIATGILIRREWFPPAAPDDLGPPVAVTNWSDLIHDGERLGAAAPLVTLVVFGDFECPYCRQFTVDVLRPFLEEHPTEVQVVARHFPLPYHANALPAARALECGVRQGSFEPLYFRLYQEQKLLGEKPFEQFAATAGVPDLPAFQDCMRQVEPIPAVARDTLLARRVGLRGTPTVIVNGMLFQRPPLRRQLDSLLAAVKRGPGA
ncbi:MAG: thioredoxin domain-containing protein [Gemmatimonadales bacterium]|nr:thioredoxin domain-containing protein [Gemmatimonadales bacterium]